MNATTPSMAEEVGNATSVGNNQVYSDERSRENKCGDVILSTKEEGCSKKPYAMEVDRGRNCYTCGGFVHIAQHCKNRGRRTRIGDSKRLEYGQK